MSIQYYNITDTNGKGAHGVITETKERVNIFPKLDFLCHIVSNKLYRFKAHSFNDISYNNGDPLYHIHDRWFNEECVMVTPPKDTSWGIWIEKSVELLKIKYNLTHHLMRKNGDFNYIFTIRIGLQLSTVIIEFDQSPYYLMTNVFRITISGEQGPLYIDLNYNLVDNPMIDLYLIDRLIKMNSIECEAVIKEYKTENPIHSELMIVKKGRPTLFNTLNMLLGFDVRIKVDETGANVKVILRRFDKLTIKKKSYIENLIKQLKIFEILGCSHSDVKSSNIMVDEFDNPWFVDLDNLIQQSISGGLSCDRRFYHMRNMLPLEDRVHLDCCLLENMMDDSRIEY
jgi:hypothetical protein